MKQTAKEYAEALFELALEEGLVDEFADALSIVKTVVKENPLCTDLLVCPAIPMSERLNVIDEAFGSLPEQVVSFLMLICQNRHAAGLLTVVEEFNLLVAASRNRTTANIVSAAPIGDEQKKRLLAKLEARFNTKIDPVFSIDPSLIGGIRIELEGQTLDGSLKTRLHDIKDVITG